MHDRGEPQYHLDLVFLGALRRAFSLTCGFFDLLLLRTTFVRRLLSGCSSIMSYARWLVSMFMMSKGS
jgi:hypothetical protein